MLFTSFPGYISVSVGIGQLMNYTVLIIKLNLIIEERKAQMYSHLRDFAARRKEMLAMLGFSLLIIAMPVIYMAQYFKNRELYDEQQHNLVDWWRIYSKQLVWCFASLGISLTLTTMYLVGRMTELFGPR